ncbi:hypothetical protein [Streptomyces sp. NPDC007172]|uniref:hypothetical protein n=1 Tax=Streptomyces sp. NPDC007172 TaxID=3364776 RepID=UPI0036905CC7
MLDNYFEQAVAHDAAVIVDCGAHHSADAHRLWLLLATRHRRQLLLVGPLTAFYAPAGRHRHRAAISVAPALTHALSLVSS